MKLAMACLLLLILGPLAAQASIKPPQDGSNEVLAVVEGKAITYQEIVGRLDLSAEIRTLRLVRGIPASIPDTEIERQLVYSELESYIIKRLLSIEADRVGFKLGDAELRAAIARERRLLGIEDGDEKRWADYLQEKFGLTPAEYRERKREDIRQTQVMYIMGGGQGAVNTRFPLSVFFSLDISPSDIRKAFEKSRGQFRVATNIEFREVKLAFPNSTSLDDRRKVTEAFQEVHTRVLAGESIEAASAGLQAVIRQLPVPGLKFTIGEKVSAANDTGLSDLQYRMVLSVPARGGYSEIGAVNETDQAGTEYQGYTFIQLFKKTEGDARRFDDPKVQAAIRQELFNRRLSENIARVQQTLLRRAVIVPERIVLR